MAERTYSMFNVPQAALTGTTPPAKVATGNSRRTMWQIQANPLASPLRIIEWGVAFDASALATAVLVELIDTGNQGASGANFTAAKMPMSLLGTAISSGATTSFVLNSGGGANFPSSGDFSVVAVPLTTTQANTPFAATSMEKALVTTRSTDTLTVVRNIDGAGALASIPVGSPILGFDGQLECDIQCDNDHNFWPMSSVVYQNSGFNSGGGVPGTDFANVTFNRLLGLQLIEPIGTIGLLQLPLAREAVVPPGHYLRIVMTASATVNALCYAKWAE